MSTVLDGVHAVVTGGGHGLGAVIARRLADAGARLTLMGRNRDQLTATGASIADSHERIALAQCDVTDPASVSAAFASARERFGDPLILVNNAGQAMAATFMDTALDAWQRMIEVNLTGAFLCTQAALPGMLAARTGRIINIASTAGLRGYARVVAYSASKHGVVGLTRALAQEVVRQGVTVNAVCPSYVEGEMTERTIAGIAEGRGIGADEARQKLERTIPLGRLIRPEEVAHTVLWLCSPDAGAITGQAIAVAGGEVS
jgi:NAD(P)-dependent dehydrogenase (short-subunit alcohol dehydrogenase family)